MRNKKVLEGLSLNVDAELINLEHEGNSKLGYCMGDSTYRHDGFSIGKDFLRLEGRTVTRGELAPSSLILKELIGEGAFSKVHKGKWKRNSTEKSKGEGAEETVVAVKSFCLLDSSSQRRSMLLKELRTLCRIDCESLVKLEGAFLFDDTVTMVLEFMNRGSLEDILKRNRKTGATLKEPFIASLAFQMLWGLSYLHHERFIHRDIKPGNVLINSDGKVKLCDFGLASLSDKSLQTTVVGTTRYMAPERLRSKPYGRSSDIWSFGLVLLECLTGDIPWKECDSIVSLLMSVEEATFEDLVQDSVSSQSLDFLRMCLQYLPGKFQILCFVIRSLA
jgi:serine/threonine protein kinase